MTAMRTLCDALSVQPDEAPESDRYCLGLPGHEGKHRNFLGIEWSEAQNELQRPTKTASRHVTALLPASPPDEELTQLRRVDFLDLLHEGSMSEPSATFVGVGYALGVWLCADLQTYAVAPLWIGGPPAAIARHSVKLFRASSTQDTGHAYARACLHALLDTALSVESEVQA